MMMILLSTIVAQGQIKIGGNVYGGGNHAEVRGNTKVTVLKGDIGAVMDPNAVRPLADPSGKVFGGARMANVGGNTFVHIDGEHATDYILINQVFGGNDISGKIGTAMTVGEDVPTELTAIKSAMPPSLPEGKTEEHYNDVGKTFNSYVRISTLATSDHYTQEEIDDASTDPEDPAYGKRTTDVKPDPAAKKVYIGQLFSGGNGDYTYLDDNGGPLRDGDDYIAKQGSIIIARSATPFVHPEQDSTYLEVLGGSIVYAYGGGNNATVKEQTIIHIDNPSAVVNHIWTNAAGVEVAEGTTGAIDLLTNARFKEMGINTTFSQPSSGAYQVGRFFGGNNKAEMDIRPTWNLLAGKVRNLYSGGNKGAMTSPEGLLLEIKDYSSLIVDNLYGGCRMADVKPMVNGEYVPCTNLPGYYFPSELSARVLIKGGHINNVYGGNDVTGTVYGGNAVGINTTVYGDVYGGGNGAYPYTDSPSNENDDTYGDFYYGNTGSGTEGLNAFRPNAEQVSIHLVGTKEHKTVIKGSVFVGGNCASLATKKPQPLVELKIGSHVIADKVFLGNNGEKMVDPSLLELYKTNSSIILTDKSVFARYMEGVAMPLKPNIVFDNTANGDAATYLDNTSMIGSFYGGGNRGSMTVGGKTTLKFDRKLIIFDKIVAGCNNANVAEGTYNAAYEGGLLGSEDERESYTDGSGKIKDRLQLDLDNVVIRPQRWNDTFTKVADGTTLTKGKEYYTTDLHGTRFIAKGTEVSTTTDPYYELATIGTKLEWNTVKWDIGEDDFISTGTTDPADDLDRRLIEGSVYGGCYNSGHVNGNVVININQDLVERDTIFAQAAADDPYTISGERRSGVLKEAQGDDVQSSALSVYGGGYGADTEIWGSTTINHNNGYAFQMYGGGEEGVVGRKNSSGEYVYNAAYSTTVNLKGINPGYSETESGLPIPETEYIYGGGNEGDVLGDSYVYLGNGRIYDAFGGASNADIYGGTEVHIGYNGGFPWIRDNVYGGNDFGGTVRGNRNHYTVTTRGVFDQELKRSSTYVKYIQGRVDSIFGGNYGSYDYVDRVFKDYTNDNGSPKEGFSFPNLINNTFVHFVPEDHSCNYVGYIFGGSEGYPGHEKLCNSMQKNTYVLLDDTKTKDANRFANVDVYGGGAFAGVGTSEHLGAGRTAIDLFAGSFHNIYGGCNQEGLVGYTRVNVPAGSTAKVNALFGGGKGYDPALFKVDATKELAERFCDHYVTCIDFKSKNAIVNDAIYGGNENGRISCDTYINIEAPVMQSSGYQATVYGAGYGGETVSGRTNVFMNNGSNAYKVFGGGRDGNAFNFASLTQWLINQYMTAGTTDESAINDKITAYRGILNSFGTYLAANPISLPNRTGTYVNESGEYDGTYTNDILPTLEKPMPAYHQTNVHIMNGGNVSGYAYGGGYGLNAVVAGSTYIELKGGNVNKDIYGGGEGGPVFDEFALKTFTATTNVNIEGGMARNVYGGGYEGHVGKHEGDISASNTGDIPAITNVIVGKADGTNFYNGIPAIQRNAYGGGEGGSVFGTTNLTINNGYIGYRYKNISTTSIPAYEYVPELDDQTPNAIELAGNAFGGGYVINSYVDDANVRMYGGIVRGSLYGGGELGPIGRGTMKDGATIANGGVKNGKATIYKAGKTHVHLFDGHVLRNVFGGGRGKDSWGGDGTKYMDADLLLTLDLKSKGYVFGQTEVEIHGGEVGTDEGVAQGYGNVFGAGDIGCVYSAYENESGFLSIGKKSGVRYGDADEGYYYKYENSAYKLDGSEKILTEDCRVVVAPSCKANSDVVINGTPYAAGVYVPTAALNYLGNKTASATEWTALGKTDVNKEGVIIHNAVFAGGNTSPGSTEVFANTPTVFGNATASIHDVYNRDLISIGRGRVGGLYGDGNLTLVDGYRELNITNYGTDFYHINPEITLEQYNALPVREAAYYEIRYKCLQQCTDKDGKTYAVGSTITADEMLTVFDGVTVGGVSMIKSDGKPLETYWKENGVCSRYAGRPMNTIQRADFCGVFGSRMVMQGAQDRVPEVVDYTNYTINRVREVSLNKKTSVRTEDAGDAKNKEHGNYFGIYSVVNYLGALTSDLDFHSAVRVTDNTDATTYQCAANEKAYGTATYYDWKDQFHAERRRNNGNSHNKVALASGVYLELTTEKSTGKDLKDKDWGYITGVVELDLINVQPGMGGGYVYAKNEHGVRSGTGKTHTILATLNTGAVTNKSFQYAPADNTKKEWETSGNFVHSTQTIIDDCYNIGNKYKGTDAVPAHYWFIKGAIYVYDQYISAYTGSPNAFSEAVSIPLTITSASHGKMTLLDVMPNRYAYYSNGATKDKLGADQKITIREKEYGLNDVINYWDYSQLTATEKNMFVDDTYITIAACKIGNTTYPAGEVLLPSEYSALKAANPTVYHVVKEKDVDFDEVFRSSNNVSHNTGYILTYNIDNPNLWNKWYTKADEATKNQTGGAGFEDGPTYTPTKTGMFGQNDYKVASIISKEDYDTYQAVATNHSSAIPAGQATFVPAYMVTAEVLETKNKDDIDQRFHKGATLAKEEYTAAQWSAITGSVASAYVATKTVQLSKTEFIYRNTYLTETQKNAYETAYPALAEAIESAVQPAYYCLTAGKYGGNYYQKDHNYRALSAFTAMTQNDRSNFNYNYDALDLLIDPDYSRAEGVKYQYDSSSATKDGANANLAHYSLPTSIDYTATYKGTGSLTYTADDQTQKTATEGTELSRTEYERLPNEQYYWAPIKVSTPGTYYVAKETIILGDTPYAAGQVITSDTYSGLSVTDKAKVATLTFPSTGDYYYCRESYPISTGDDGHAVNSATGVTGAVGGNYAKGQEVTTGVVIDNVAYGNLTNRQRNFAIHGVSPTETSTLYVTRGSDIFDLSKEKIITVIYQYDYVESDMDGQHITPVSERHILNIHLNFKSGVPTVEDIRQPDIILPGTSLSMPEPYVTPGAYEITGGGWKLFEKESDAESHINGVEYTPSEEPLYLYQNKYYLAYYTKTYLGETYSNHVPVSVANYHDLKKIMGDKDHHYYIDHEDIFDRLKVEPKIYINDYSSSSENGLDLLKNLYDLSIGETLTGHNPLNERVKGGKNLEFFLRTDIDHPATWTPIGTDAECFKGTLHGDGHTISGLDHSLFNNLCGNVYNLGVTGSFNSAGVADKGPGYVESAWVKTTNATPLGTKPYAVFGAPSDSEGSQLVNSYFYAGNNNLYNTNTSTTDGVTTSGGDRGTARAMTAQEFYNGTVAYNLNNFYLYKRYSDQMVTSGNENEKYSYFTIDNKGKLVLQNNHYYTANAALCSTGHEDKESNVIMYVEDRFADGDFRYAGGTIPDSEDERFYTWTVTDPDTGKETVESTFFPIWPDDYIFFGQKLTYGWAVEAHQDVPAAVVRDGGRLFYGNDANRVYRAPAYYRSKTMGVAHFNQQAYLAQTKKDVPTTLAYPNMTAIDFAGHNDMHDEATEAQKPYELGMNAGKFYAPLLDDDGLRGIVNCDETKNLLAYAPAEADNKQTLGVLDAYFSEPIYENHYDNSIGYRLVSEAATATVHGHLVQNTLKAINDHLLVDHQDFNAPFAYDFDKDHLMWYQRIPADEEYVDLTKGWQGISVPFTAELVTTNQKGEITHFYSGSDESHNETETKTKKGHEYWLRQLTDGAPMTEKSTGVLEANFHYPAAAGDNKTVGNTFLWDYYYKNESVHDQQDKNADTYLEYRQYYKTARSYAKYPMLSAATPYILGLPGQTYYEFDLSGKFEALNTAADISKLGKQIITLASNKGEHIGVSDDEMTGMVAKFGGNYTFKPSYMNETLSADNYYALNAAGNSYDKVTATTNVSAFRPYFVGPAATSARQYVPKQIVFGAANGELKDGPESALDGGLEIYVKDHKIVTTSHLKEATTISIVNVSGIHLADYVLKPGDTIETPVHNAGVFIVNKKKVFVR